MITNIKRIATKFSWCLVFILVFFSVSSEAQAASLSVSPSAGVYDLGSIFSIKVLVSSQDTTMNAASGVISFSKDKLEVTSVSKSGSIIGLWVQDPSFSNDAGTINFEGVVLNPGFQGSNGQLVTVNFRAKSAGAATAAFAAGSVLANDGRGTEIIKGTTNANFTLKTAAPQGMIGLTTPSETGTSGPQISSPSHSDQNKWYADGNPKFIWNVPTGVTAVRLLYDKYPQSAPTVVYEPAIAEKTLSNIPDGIWYMHVQFRDGNGWGSIAHFRFQIDTQPPEKFVIKFVGVRESTSPRPTVLFDTADALSGIDYYKVKVGNSDFVQMTADTIKSNPYTLPPEDPGNYSMLVQAFDKAGNYETAVADFSIKPLDPPIITDYSKDLRQGEFISVRGETYPDSQVEVWLEKDGILMKQYTAKSTNDGGFTITGDGNTDVGVYKIWAKVTDARGAKSLPSEKFNLTISKSNILRIGSLAVSALSVIVSFLALVALAIFGFWYSRQQLQKLRAKIKKGIQTTERDIHKDFDILKNSIANHIRILEKAKTKRELTEEENKILSQLRRDLDKAEEAIGGEIEKIERDLK